MSVHDEVTKAARDIALPDLKEVRSELKDVRIRLDRLNQRFDDLIDQLDREAEAGKGSSQ